MHQQSVEKFKIQFSKNKFSKAQANYIHSHNHATKHEIWAWI